MTPRLTGLIVASLLTTVPAFAAPILPMVDQRHDVVFDETLASQTVQGQFPRIDIAQTFTVGQAGLLTQVDLFFDDLDNVGEYFFDVRRTVNGIPVENDRDILVKASIEAKEVDPGRDGWVSFDVINDKLFVNTGEVLALVLRCEAGCRGNVTGNIENPYAGGRAFARQREGLPPADQTWASHLSGQPDRDFGFRTHVADVPEPGTLALLSTGALIFWRRRRGKQPPAASGPVQ